MSRDVANSDAILAVLRENYDFLVGTHDEAVIVEEWSQTNMTLEQIEAWTSAGCFDARSAFLMAEAGITPSEAATYHYLGDLTVTIAYAVANGDLTVTRAAEMVGVL